MKEIKPSVDCAWGRYRSLSGSRSSGHRSGCGRTRMCPGHPPASGSGVLRFSPTGDHDSALHSAASPIQRPAGGCLLGESLPKACSQLEAMEVASTRAMRCSDKKVDRRSVAIRSLRMRRLSYALGAYCA